jgi:hypothetical protein
MNLAGEERRNSSARSRTATARRSFDPSLPRQGRLARQCKRAFLAHNNQPLSMRELREWCYPGRERQHWFYINIKRALRKLGAVQIGRAGGIGRPAIYATCLQHDTRNDHK